MLLDYSKNDFNKNVKPILEKELFTNGISAEIIKYLEKDYNNEKFYFPNKDEVIKAELNEKILLDLNNELINKYLIRYCKSENTFYYLLQIDESLINQAIFNHNITLFNSDKLFEILIQNLKLLELFFKNLIENSDSIFNAKKYIIELINKNGKFNILSNEEYINLLQEILPLSKISDIIEYEINNDDFLSNDNAILQISIWNLLCNLEVNESTIKLLSWTSENGYRNLSNGYNSTQTIEEVLEKWSNYNYQKPDEEYGYSSYADYNDRINIQMLISAYGEIFNLKKDLMVKYDGVKAYLYKSVHWTNLSEKYNKEELFEDFIKYELFDGEKYYIDDDNEVLKYFKLNKLNYDKKYFKIFKEYFSPDENLVIENFEKIGSAITSFDLWDIENILDEKKLEKEKIKYYMNIYYSQVEQSKLMDKIDNLPNQDAFNNLYAELELVKNKKDTWIYLLLIVIIILLILK